MVIPEALGERFPFLNALEDEWEPVSRASLIGWLAFYAILIGNAALRGTLFQLFDLVFVPIHEGGHLLFGYFGRWIMVFGGTFLQLFVPFALAVFFMLQRQVPGTAFCTFLLFEQFLPVGTYMADARCVCLEYVTIGDPEFAEHDWTYLFTHAGVLEHDIQIGSTFRMLGWMGMLATVGWFAWRSWRKA